MGAATDVLLGLAIVFPGLWAYWRGRRFCRDHDHAMAAEQWLKHQVKAVGVLLGSVVFAAILGHDKPCGWLWALLLPWLALTVGRYPSIRFQAGGTWSFGAYLAHVIRFAIAMSFTWVFIIMVPIAMDDVRGQARWLMAGGLTMVWLVWSRFAGRWIPLLMGMRPITDPELQSRFAAIVAHAGIAAPRIGRADTPPGLWPNACAIVGKRAQAIVMGSTLLAALTPDESAAIFAHEVAHLEHFRGKAGRRIAIIQWSAFVLGISAIPVLAWLDLAGTFTAPVILWINIAFMALARAQTGGKEHEADSDVRAVALCGDAEALIRGLTKLHLLASMPRRWEAELEENASHPSLARRIQAIRQAAGVVTPAPTSDTIIAGARPGSYVVFSGRGVVVLEDAPASAPLELGRLQAEAKVQRSWAYERLSHLGLVSLADDACALEIVEVGGSRTRVPLRADAVASAQAMLDGVDGLLSAKPTLGKRASPWLLFAALVTLFFVATSRTHQLIPLAIVILAALVEWRPTGALLTMLAAAVLGESLLLLASWLGGDGHPYWAGWVVLVGVGALYAVLAARRGSAEDEGAVRRARTASLLSLVVLVLSLASWPWAESASARHEFAASHPGAGWQLIGLAALLWAGHWRRRIARPLSVAVALAGLLPCLWGSRWYAEHRARDPFLAPTPAIAWQQAAPGEAWPPLTDRRIAALELAPAGDAIFYERIDATEGDEPDEPADEAEPAAKPASASLPTRTFVWQSRGGQRQQLAALDAHALDGGRAVVLRAADSGLLLQVIDVAGAASASGWQLALPALRGPTLTVEADSQAWRVTSRRGNKQQWLEGKLGTSAYEEVRFTLDRQGRFVAAGDRSGGIVTVPRYDRESHVLPPLMRGILAWVGEVGWHAAGGMVETRIWQIDGQGRTTTSLGATSSWLQCDDAILGTRRFLCSSHGGSGNSGLGWLEPGHGALSFVPLARHAPELFHQRRLGPHGSVAWQERDAIAWVDASRGVGVRAPIDVPTDSARREAGDFAPLLFALARSRLAVAVADADAWRLSVFRLP